MELPPFYYLDNFLSLLRSVYSQYDDLLNEQELGFYQDIHALERDAQAVFIRLLSRRGETFRSSKIAYAEIEDMPAAIDDLVATGFVELDPDADNETLFRLFTKSEWLHFLDQPGLRSLSKRELFPHIQEQFQHRESPAASVSAACGERLLQLKRFDAFETFRLLYFGNGRQDLTDFILRDLGIYRYEKYQLDKQTRFATSRRHIDELQLYYRLREQLEDIGDLDVGQLWDFYRILPPLLEAQRSSSLYIERSINRRMQGLRLRIARQMERLQALDKALTIYTQCDAPPSRERQARIHAKLGENTIAIELCEHMAGEGSEAERVFAHEFSVRLAKKVGVERQASRKAGVRRAEFGEERLALARQEGLLVEQVAALYFSGEGATWHVENHLFLGVFGLVFWPALFAEVPGAFSHPFQWAPHDLYEHDFPERREQKIKECWRQLETWKRDPQSFLEFVQSKQGIANAFVSWGLLHEDMLLLAMERIPLEHWQAVFQRLWRDLRENRNGLPDLVHFPHAGGYELIEIKGPGDRLQKNQKRWLEYFVLQGISARVVYIDWDDN